MYFDGALKIDNAGQGSFSYLQRKKSSSTSSKSCSRHQITQPGMKCLSTMCIAVSLSIKCLMVGDSFVVINQANKAWSSTREKMSMYYVGVRNFEGKFHDFAAAPHDPQGLQGYLCLDLQGPRSKHVSLCVTSKLLAWKPDEDTNMLVLTYNTNIPPRFYQSTEKMAQLRTNSTN